jgi:hypothetical protein
MCRYEYFRIVKLWVLMIALLLTNLKIFEWLAYKIGKRDDLWNFLEDECMAQTICEIRELCSGTSKINS